MFYRTTRDMLSAISEALREALASSLPSPRNRPAQLDGGDAKCVTENSFGRVFCP
jgi:hypothetical protein